MRTILTNARAAPLPLPNLGSFPSTLADAPIGQTFVVQSLSCPVAAPQWMQWLEEIGFLPGEQVMLLTRAQPGGDPLVVRIGSSTFALRVAEAACIRLAPADIRRPGVTPEAA